jgi:hypothetical protein
MRRLPGIGTAVFGLLFYGAAALADVVVLKGGTVIPLKQPVVRRGNTAYITRTDGTLLSVPASEIDRDATAAANRPKEAPAAPAAAPPASNPADAARAKEGQKAKVRITDADVSHPLEFPEATDAAKDKDKKDQGGGSGIGRVEVADYTREVNGATLVVKGSLRNPGQGPAENVRLSISAFDEKGQSIDGTNASLSKGTVDPGSTVEFTATLTVGEKTVGTLKFQPQWTTPKPPPSAAAPGQAPVAGGAPANAPPKPVPTPYGRGTLYAAPPANASTDRPTDSNTGYLPGVSSPDNQPKPPTP